MVHSTVNLLQVEGQTTPSHTVYLLLHESVYLLLHTISTLTQIGKAYDSVHEQRNFNALPTRYL